MAKTHCFEDLNQVYEAFENQGREVRSLANETVLRQRRTVARLLPQLGAVDPKSLGAITTQQVENFMIALSEQAGPGTYHWASYSLKSFFRFAQISKLVAPALHEWIPCVYKPRLAKVPFYLSMEQIEKLQKDINPSNPKDIRDHAILAMLSIYGVRGIQVRKLKLSDLDWSNDRIHFPAVKRGLSLTMPLTTAVGNSLLRYLARVRPRSSHSEVFLSHRNGRPIINASYLTAMVVSRLKRSEIKIPKGVPVGTHLFRHSLASRLLQKEVPIKQIADMLGHKDLNSTMIYTKIDLKSLQQVCQEWPEARP